MKNLFFIAMSVFYYTAIQASWLDLESINPELRSLKLKTSLISEQQFHQNVKDIQDIYAPIVSQVGGKLKITGEWKNDQPNAAASQMFGNWQVKITGGLARRPELTADGFSLIICHELGHHLGGFPIATSQGFGGGSWAANEGQSDYYATHVCAKRIWGDKTQENSAFRTLVSEKERRLCDSIYTEVTEQDLCYRVVIAMQSVTKTMAVLMNKPIPELDTPDTNVVAETSHKHPMPQCRLDTSLQGALCTQIFNDKIIPGKNVSSGPSSIEAEREASAFSCMKHSGYEVGLRPTCWFKPRL